MATEAVLAGATFEAWLRPDGRKGIRNVICVVYLVECAHHVARQIVNLQRALTFI